MKTVVILPTYNELENLPRMVSEILSRVKTDILVVDDHSPDGTGALADRIAGEHPAVFAIHRAGKMGLGTAYLEGFRWVLARDYDTVIQMDCDFSHDPKDIPRLIGALSGYDLVLGSRYVGGGRIEGWTFYRKWISSMGNRYARAILGGAIRDLTGGFKIFRRKVLENLDLGHVLSDGYAFQIEMTTRAVKKGFKVGEIPIVFGDRRFGKSKLSKKIIWEAFWIVWKLRRMPGA